MSTQSHVPLTESEAYRLLELPDGATPEEIRNAYLLLVRIWHPDRFTYDPALRRAAEDKLKRINAAYALLTELEPETPDQPETPPTETSPQSPPAYEPPHRPPVTVRHTLFAGWATGILASVAIICVIGLGGEMFLAIRRPVENLQYLLDRSGTYTPAPPIFDSAGRLLATPFELASRDQSDLSWGQRPAALSPQSSRVPGGASPNTRSPQVSWDLSEQQLLPALVPGTAGTFSIKNETAFEAMAQFWCESGWPSKSLVLKPGQTASVGGIPVGICWAAVSFTQPGSGGRRSAGAAPIRMGPLQFTHVQSGDGPRSDRYDLVLRAKPT